MTRRPVHTLQNQASDAPLIPASGPMPRRDRMLRDLGIRETLELADDLADRIEATDPSGAALLRTFRRDAGATLIRWQPPSPFARTIAHPEHDGPLQ